MTDALLNPEDLPLPLFTVAQLRDLERRAADGLPPHALMQSAGVAAARFLREALGTHAAGSARIWLAAGPGNNGGDALVCAATLHAVGFDVRVCLPQPSHAEDARWAFALAQTAGVPISLHFDAAQCAALHAADWAIDGLFGIGLTRALSGVYADIAKAFHERFQQRGKHAAILALDIPSGLDADTGNVVDAGSAVPATHTLTFLTLKPGLYTASGRDFSGITTLATLGVDAEHGQRIAGANANASISGTAAVPSTPPDPIPLPDQNGFATDNDLPLMRLNAPDLFSAALPARAHATNKGSFGSLAVVGGAAGMCGAPILAGRAALFTGAGRVHVALLGGVPPYDPAHPELMLRDVETLDVDALGLDALAIGAGMGQTPRAAALLDKLLDVNAAKAIDADALNLLATHPALAAKALRHGAGIVLTPHPLEAARLLGCTAAAVQRDRIAAARTLAAAFACVIVLKGSGTVIAAADGRLAINPSGNAGLATGGTGDVLGGIVGALLAQHLHPYEAALAAVFLHGRAAESLSAQGNGPAGLTASELAPAVRSLLNQMMEQR